jgi:tRNA threonylcarbamoyladenosine biosynthesis protein TsaB
MSIIKTFAQIFDKPIVGIDTLSILENYLPIPLGKNKIVAAINALRQEVYIKDKTNNNIEVISKDINNFIKQVKKYKNRILIIGDAAIAYKNILIEELGQYSTSLPKFMHIPQAEVLARLAYQFKSVDYKSIRLLYGRRSF